MAEKRQHTPQHTPLSELNFTDLYIRLDDEEAAHYRPRGRERREGGNREVPSEYQLDVEKIRLRLQTEHSGAESTLEYDTMRMRCSRIIMASGKEWVVLRRIPERPPALEDLGFDPALLPHLQQLGVRDGLIIIAGPTGHGKTTTACALLCDYLQRYGNVAFTVEDPVEFNLEGRHASNGFCYQVEISEDHEWATMLKRSLRWSPRYIFVGEIRTPDAAAQVLRAATTGHLVITTVHGGSIEESLEGMLHLSEQAVGSRASAALAMGLTAVIHQNLLEEQLMAKSFITEPNNLGDAFRNTIRERRIGQLATYIDQQHARLLNGGPLLATHKRLR